MAANAWPEGYAPPCEQPCGPVQLSRSRVNNGNILHIQDVAIAQRFPLQFPREHVLAGENPPPPDDVKSRTAAQPPAVVGFHSIFPEPGIGASPPPRRPPPPSVACPTQPPPMSAAPPMRPRQ